MRIRRFSLVAPFVGYLALLPGGGTVGSAQELPYALFERYVEPLRQQSGIPGLSAAIVRAGRIEWEKGFGYQDVEQAIAALPDTPYALGGVTQSFTAVLLGICVDRHALDVDEFMRRWVPAFPVAEATVRHVLAHASDPPVGTRFRYDPALFVQLTRVVDACSARPYRVAIVDEILDRLAMTSSIPGLDAVSAPARELYDTAHLSRYQALLRRVAVPYRVDRGRAVRSDFPTTSLDAASGLVSTARDLARFDTALEAGVPMSTFTLGQMWNPTRFGADSPLLPTGLGWFAQQYYGTQVVWSFGLIPDAGSALIIKVPQKRLNLYMLANGPGLAAGAQLEQGDLTTSAFAKVFLRLFV